MGAGGRRWTGAASFQQHDVMEMAHVLFDALDRSTRGVCVCVCVCVCVFVCVCVLVCVCVCA